ncbi:helix-turn-helix transcriptional regulator [Chelonobacter oris]|uniref:helix-turn-helix transcriptional regulator n=1 Tax=Chelonobacter oris TaxID=505317 RepID=UPI003133B070
MRCWRSRSASIGRNGRLNRKSPDTIMEQQPALLSKARVIEITSLSHTTIWRMMKNGTFPKSVKASMGRVAWRKSDIDNWLAERT